MNEAVARTSTPRLAGLVSLLDRLFPLLWLGLYLLLPVSGWADEMFETWFDQRRDLEALRTLLAGGEAAAITENAIGPAYVGVAALVHEVSGLTPEDALVALSRASYALSVAAGLVLVRVLLARFAPVPPMVSLASQIVLAGLVFAAGTWYWSDVPWSHFFAALLAVAAYAARFAPARPGALQAVAVGILLALLAATRTFELAAVALAWGIVLVVLAALRVAPSLPHARHALAGAVAFVATTAVAYVGTGKRDLFLYGNDLSRQAGSLSGAEVAETPTFGFGLVPTKLLQLFVDPCHLSLCEISDYETGGGAGSNLDLWSLPLAVQLPALVLLPLCIVGVGVLVTRGLRRANRAVAVETWRPLAELTVAATGLVVGYAASTLTGPSHLRYGFARDFLLPALLTAIVAVVLGSRGLWLLLERRRERWPSGEAAFVAVAFVVAVAAVSVATVTRSSGLPRIEARHLGTVTYTARCVSDACRVGVEATTPGGRPISIPQPSTLTFGCGSDRPRFTLYVDALDEPVRIASACPDPRLVAAWPTVMGLPPGAFELAAVGVRNA